MDQSYCILKIGINSSILYWLFCLFLLTWQRECIYVIKILSSICVLIYYCSGVCVGRGWVNLPQNARDWKEIPQTWVPNALLCSRLAIYLRTEKEQKFWVHQKYGLSTFSYIFAMFYCLNISIVYRVYMFSISQSPLNFGKCCSHMCSCKLFILYIFLRFFFLKILVYHLAV